MYCVLYSLFNSKEMEKWIKKTPHNCIVTIIAHHTKLGTFYLTKNSAIDNMYKVVNAKRMDLKMGAFLMEVEKDESAFIYVLS